MAQPQPETAHAELSAQLLRASDELDSLIGAMELGPRNQAAFDDFEERAQRIAQRIVIAFRGANARPTRLLKREKSGGCWF